MNEFSILPDRQIERRWFKDDQVDVVIWLLDAGDYRFEISYHAKDGHGQLEQRVIKYSASEGLTHHCAIGEQKDISTPKVLQPSEAPIPAQAIIRYLGANQGKISDPILGFVSRTLSPA